MGFVPLLEVLNHLQYAVKFRTQMEQLLMRSIFLFSNDVTLIYIHLFHSMINFFLYI